MRPSFPWIPLALAALLPAAPLAQQLGGGSAPEAASGSDAHAPGATTYSFSLQLGAIATPDSPHVPFFVGGAADLWLEGWLQFELSTAYMFDTQRTQVLAGPRLRSAVGPFEVTGALEAGPIFFKGGLTRFGISPNGGGELTIGEHTSVGLHYAVDIPTPDGPISQRFYLALGWRT
jgi:hypothetical protein